MVELLLMYMMFIEDEQNQQLLMYAVVDVYDVY